MILSFLKYKLRRPLLKLLMFAGCLLDKCFDKRLDKSRVRKILIIQFGGIGDVIRIFPSIQVLHREFPQASITALTEFDERIFDLFINKKIIANFVQLDPRNQHKSFFSKLRLIKLLRKEGFDLTYHPGYGYGMMEFSIISFLISSRYRIGFKMDGAGFLNTTKKELLKGHSIVEQQLVLLSEAGIYNRNDDFGQYMSIRREDMDYARRFYKSCDLSHSRLVITVHPWAKWETKGRCWPMDRYIELIEKVIQRYEAKVIILGGENEKWVADRIKEKIGSNIVSPPGQTTIGETAAIISLSDLFIGNDSGLLHLAIGSSIAAVGIFGFTLSKQVIYPNPIFMAVESSLGCRPCYYHQPLFKFKCKHADCLNCISVGEVMESVESALKHMRLDRTAFMCNERHERYREGGR